MRLLHIIDYRNFYNRPSAVAYVTVDRPERPWTPLGYRVEIVRTSIYTTTDEYSASVYRIGGEWDWTWPAPGTLDFSLVRDEEEAARVVEGLLEFPAVVDLLRPALADR